MMNRVVGHTALLVALAFLGCVAHAQESSSQVVPITEPKDTANRPVKKPNAMLVENDRLTFAGVDMPMAPAEPGTRLIVQATKQVASVKALTGDFVFNRGGLSAQKTLVKPKNGMMIVKVIFDLYTENENEVIWYDNIVLLGGDGSRNKPFQLVEGSDGASILTVGFNGLAIKNGIHRIAAFFAAKKGNLARFHLNLNGTDYKLMNQHRN
jgi:hypothetical protein